MKILVIKTSSLGDVVHMLPAINDAARSVANLEIDWVVEEGFAEVPSWHPGVRNIIPLAIRRWRKKLYSRQTWREINAFLQRVWEEDYDLVLDTQGLFKSALIARLAKGTSFGYDRHSIREPFASLLYQQRASVSRQLHAVTRNRQLTAAALGYTLDDLPLDYGISHSQFPQPQTELPENYVVALHGTSRPAKEWPEDSWQAFITTMAELGIHTLLPWGNVRERERAEQLAKQQAYAQVLPRCRLGELAYILQHAKGVIGMDTGLMHIAAALDQRGIALYPATAPELTGILGNSTTPQPIITLGGEETYDTAIIVQRMADLLDT